MSTRKRVKPKTKPTTMQRRMAAKKEISMGYMLSPELAKAKLRELGLRTANEGTVVNAVYSEVAQPRAGRETSMEQTNRNTTKEAWSLMNKAREEWVRTAAQLEDTHPLHPNFMDVAGQAHAAKQNYLSSVEHFRDAVSPSPA